MTERSRVRLLVVQVLVLSLFVTLGGRLWYLQVASGAAYAQAATANQQRSTTVPAVRGQIVDDQGRALVRNETAVQVAVDRSTLERQDDGGTAVLTRLAALLGTTVEDVELRSTPCGADTPRGCWNGSPYAPAVVTEDAPESVLLQVRERQELYPGVTAELAPVRSFPAPSGANAAHLLGYLSPVTEDELTAADSTLDRQDLVGRTGLESEYDAFLRGTDGTSTLAVDSAGRVTGTLASTPAEPGGTLVTSIDAGVQAVAEQQLQAALERARGLRDPLGALYAADSGAVVVLDHTTGRVVAMASAPTFDPAVWTGGISATDYAALTDPAAGDPSVSRATQGLSAPASTFKAISASAALTAGYPADGQYDCPSTYTAGNRVFTNYESQAYGWISMRRALEVSCDTVFYKIADELWRAGGGISAGTDAADPLVTAAQGFGLGAETGVDLPSESAGRIADRAWKLQNWTDTKDDTCRRADEGYPEVAATDPTRAAYLQEIARDNCVDGGTYRVGDAINFAIGQGDTLVTPLQMAVVYSAVAQGGAIWSPKLAKAVLAPDGTVLETVDPEQVGTAPVTPEALAYVRDSLYSVTLNGSGRSSFAGWPLDTHPVATKTGTGEVYGKQTTSWFASFDDRYTIVMTVSQGGTGSGTSGPSVRAIYDAIYGMAGQPALLAGGLPPTGLPTAAADGSLVAPVALPAQVGPADGADPSATGAERVLALARPEELQP